MTARAAPPSAADNWLPVRDVASRIRVTKDTIYRLISDGELDARDVGRENATRLRVSEKSLDAFLERRRLATKETA